MIFYSEDKKYCNVYKHVDSFYKTFVKHDVVFKIDNLTI